MRTTPLLRRAAVVLLAGGLLFGSAACSKDDDKDKAATTTTAADAGSGSVAKFCDAESATRTADPGERLDRLIAVAPSDIKADLQAMKKALDTQNDPKADAIEKAEAQQATAEPFQRVGAYITDNC